MIWQVDYAVAIDCDGEPTSIDGKLRKKLLCSNYDKSQRPVKDHTTGVNITLLMNVKNYYLSETRPGLYLSVWMTFDWRDEFLTWSRAEYGLDKLTIASDDIWRPSIVTYNERSVGTADKTCHNFECEVKLNGNVSCTSPCSYEVMCNSNNADWPFDVMSCSLYLTSWLEKANKLHISDRSNVSLQYLAMAHSSWKLLLANTTALAYDMENDPFTLLKYSFKFERHMGVYSAILTPGFLMIAVSLAVLWLNSGCNERLYILCATCMGHFTYTQYIYWHVPYHGEDVPKLRNMILIFFRDSLFINMFMLVFTIILRHTVPKTDRPERLVDKLAFRVAATSFGRVLLQPIDPLGTPKVDENGAVNCDASDDPLTKEAKLLRNLFCFNYDKSERPVKNHNTAVNVTASMHVQNYDVSERESILHLYVWMSLSWRDEYLNWDRTEYGIDKLIVDSSELWRPTFVAFHNLKSGNGDSACASHPCEVNQTGNVLCVPPCQYEALCVRNTVNFPFDDLKCTMFLGTWLEDFNQINISRISNVTTRHIEVQHTEWKLQSAVILHIFLPDNTSYPALEYIFTLERHVAIYGAILTPGFLMVVINLAVLWMNCGNNERLYILCATCMGHFTYMEYLYWRVPYHGENVPKILLFFRDSLIINVLMLVFTIILRHTAPKAADSSERLVDKLAHRVASTGLGRVFLQTDDVTDGKQPGTAEDESAERENATRSEHADGDTVNLVVDAPEHTAPVVPAGRAGQQRANVVIIFMDRMMFVCFTFCYVFMICSLLPKEMM
uniref:C2H2-type domain-containing protein n=1 Tax=Anopheles dirus TaxID=7168 RepID=A0A182NNT2_9DIPT